ncbi:CG13972 [Drosophila busckii]|uniref:Dynein regulatory complex protein 9 n=1 Tax=Drosophila busckii TaxID=30019 RepID=A0A0M3QXA0_DROBS|nr:dynein regulatory complex protein 9 [Drosophila busckii]ALC45563.1 CG13972 [Drosophila busckii]
MESLEQSEAQRRLLLRYCFRQSCNQLVLQQRSQRLHMKKPLPTLPASLRRLRSGSLGQKSLPERVLLTGKKLPRLQSLLGEPEQPEEQLDECVLNALKYERDMDALRAVFETAIKQLDDEHDEPDALQAAISALSGSNSEAAVAANELQQSKDELKQLQAQLEQLNLDSVSKLQAMDERLADAKYNLRCVSRVNELEFHLVERWEAARETQARIWGDNAERAYLRDILDYKQRLAHEQRVSKELQTFRSHEFDDLRRRIKQAQQRYASDLKRVERETEAWELRILEQRKLLASNREIYEQRQQFVNEYHAKKAEEERQQNLQVHRMESAIKLQAWWRGTMVRRGLGPFKKKPKRGKRNKAKK